MTPTPSPRTAEGQALLDFLAPLLNGVAFEMVLTRILAIEAVSELGLGAACPYCGGRRWVEDENWQPDDPATWRGERTHHNGLIPCGGCNEGGWTTPDYAPANPSVGPLDEERLARAIDASWGELLAPLGGQPDGLLRSAAAIAATYSEEGAG